MSCECRELVQGLSESKRCDKCGMFLPRTVTNRTIAIARGIQAQPWPVVLLPMKLLSKPFDRGAGDIIARVIGPIGGDAFKKWYKIMFRKSCGCGIRQDALNQRWPL